MCVKNDSSQLIHLLTKTKNIVCIIFDILQLVATVFYFFAEAKIDIYNKLSISQKFLL